MQHTLRRTRFTLATNVRISVSFYWPYELFNKYRGTKSLKLDFFLNFLYTQRDNVWMKIELFFLKLNKQKLARLPHLKSLNHYVKLYSSIKITFN